MFQNHTPFPRPLQDSEFADLHGDLSEYDTYIAAEISRSIGRKRFRSKYRRNPDLRRRIQELMSRKPEQRVVLQLYERIYDELDLMLALMEKLYRLYKR